jgi:membrane fusion protein, multidrug efflux system
MRLVPVLLALLVTAFLFALVLHRDALLAIAGNEPPPPAAATPATATPAADPGPAPVRVVAMASTARGIEDAVILRGETQAAREVELRAETAGRVVSDPLRRGAFVEEGQVICQIDIGTRAAMLAEAEARLADARINFSAADRLSQDGFASSTRVATTEANLRAAEAAVAAATTEIARLTISAPFAGILESDSAEIGSLLQPGGLCATVIQLDPIRLVGFVPETEVDRIETGAMAGARLATGREVTGRVSFISRAADPMTRTFRVDIEVANADLAIRDGQTAEIAVAAQGTRAHLLPQSALTLNDDGALGVRLVGPDQTATFAPVSLLRDTAQGVWVGGLEDRADVIVVGQEYVTDGVPVIPTFREVQ